ncbi:uncharacterized protein LOC113003161 isoform X2 [Solenopsis invicta]|uniref:uncharacterized protein LOC113003161 isoform X2 n=1 Tax=Solenopsis invicta TaxID=13686 RepID=UPI000E33F445|nr:uncharacterized protein LOC113003161 isoform X2 [Solenopsis invicta]
MHPTPLSPSVARLKLPGGTSRSRVSAESSARNCTPPQSSIGDAFNHIDGLHNLFIKSRDRHDSVSENNQDKSLYSFISLWNRIDLSRLLSTESQD